MSTLGFNGQAGEWISPRATRVEPIDVVYVDRIAARRRPARQEPVEALSRRVYVKEFCDPGIVIRVPFGHFASELWSHIRSPALLQPEARIDVLVQVYRIRLPFPVDRLELIEAPIFGDPFEPRPLGSAKACILGLTIESGTRGRAELPLRIAEPGQTLWCVRTLVDPSGDPGSMHTTVATGDPQDE